MTLAKKLWIGIFLLIILAPVGLILPGYFKAGSAWGDWGADDIQKMVGYIPQGFKKLSQMWEAPLPDYTFKNWEGKGLPQQSLAYIASAVLGIAITAGIMFFLGRKLSTRNDEPFKKK